MKAKQITWAVLAALTTAAVVTTASIGVAVHQEYSTLAHGEPPQLPQTQLNLIPAQPGEVDPAQLAAALEAAGNNPALATLGAQVVDTTTGDVVWQRDAQQPLIPASSTKILTTVAAIHSLPLTQTLRTAVFREPGSATVVIKAAGDVWMTAEQLDALVQDITASAGEGAINTVFIDISVWQGPDQVADWDPDNVNAGFVAPMQPAMLYGARLGETTGDVPRSHTPALDVAQRLASRLGAANVGTGPVPAGAEEIAAVESAPLAFRIEQMMKESDNVAAEAIGREVAVARGAEASFAGATQATLAAVTEAGLDATGVVFNDNSGLSDGNRIPAAVLTTAIAQAVTGTELRPLLGFLPVAGGAGTLQDRYADLSGRGYVRAKTGTLTGVSALAGTALGQSGRVYAFTLLVNDGDILAARAAQDQFASVLRDF